MEVRFVHKSLPRELAFPFASDCMREKGYGRIAFDEEKRPLLMQDSTVVMCANETFSPVWENRVLGYLRLTDKEIGMCGEYGWSPDEWNVFIVNDNGKTIDKL